jgi:hypothetical protein
MIKFGGFDKDGQVLLIPCVTHHYSDLPMKGLGKSMDDVGIDEPQFITTVDNKLSYTPCYTQYFCGRVVIFKIN